MNFIVLVHHTIVELIQLSGANNSEANDLLYVLLGVFANNKFHVFLFIFKFFYSDSRYFYSNSRFFYSNFTSTKIVEDVLLLDNSLLNYIVDAKSDKTPTVSATLQIIKRPWESRSLLPVLRSVHSAV